MWAVADVAWEWWAALSYLLVGVELTRDAYLSDKETFDSYPGWSWVFGALFGVLLWPAILWLGRNG
jgi:hypothetical protein